MDEIRAMILTMWRMKFKLLVSFCPFVIVLLAFVAFVRWNGSIVLGNYYYLDTINFICIKWHLPYCYFISQNAGAKEAHAVSLHFAQIMYFGIFSALVMAPMHCNLSQIRDMFHSFWRGRPLGIFQVLIALLAGFISIHYFRLVQFQRQVSLVFEGLDFSLIACYNLWDHSAKKYH